MRRAWLVLACLLMLPVAVRAAGCVVLCYHHIDTPGPKVGKSGVEYFVPPADFAAQMEHLKTEGYHVVPLAAVVDAYHGKGTLPDRAVAITMDDGWKCANTNALPVLKQYGFPVTLFIYPAMIGKAGDKNTYDDYKAFAADPNVTIACHSWSHPNLLKDGEKVKGAAHDAWLQKEYVQSRAELEKKLGMPIRWLAYPYGLYDAQVSALVKQAGYEAAFSVNGAPNSAKSDPMFLNRTMILHSDGLKGFARKVGTLPLMVEGQDPPDGATIPPGIRKVSVHIVDPDALPGSIQLIMGSRHGTVDPATGVGTIAIDKPLTGHMYQIAAQAKDKTTGKLRAASWLVRVKPGASKPPGEVE